jgi:hypothetical protein
MNPAAAAVRLISVPDGVEDMAEKMQHPLQPVLANRLGTGIDTTINRLGQYPQKSDELLKELR